MPVGFAVAALAMIGVSEANAAWQSLAMGLLFVGVPALDTALRGRLAATRRGISILTGGRDHLTHRARKRLRTTRAVALALGGAQAVISALALVAIRGGSVGHRARGGAALPDRRRRRDRACSTPGSAPVGPAVGHAGAAGAAPRRSSPCATLRCGAAVAPAPPAARDLPRSQPVLLAASTTRGSGCRPAWRSSCLVTGGRDRGAPPAQPRAAVAGPGRASAGSPPGRSARRCGRSRSSRPSSTATASWCWPRSSRPCCCSSAAIGARCGWWAL